MGVSMLVKDQFRTPAALFLAEDRRGDRGFTVDGAASPHDTLCSRWWGPGGEVEDALEASWEEERVFCNCPYSLIPEFLEKATITPSMRATFLLPAWPDRKWWHHYIWDSAAAHWRPGVSCQFLSGRVKFLNPDGSLPPNGGKFPSCVVEIVR